MTARVLYELGEWVRWRNTLHSPVVSKGNGKVWKKGNERRGKNIYWFLRSVLDFLHSMNNFIEASTLITTQFKRHGILCVVFRIKWNAYCRDATHSSESATDNVLQEKFRIHKLGSICSSL